MGGSDLDLKSPLELVAHVDKVMFVFSGDFPSLPFQNEQCHFLMMFLGLLCDVAAGYSLMCFR